MLTDGADPDKIGTFQRYRPAFYVAGPGEASLHNPLYLLDEFWAHAMKDKQHETIHLYPHSDVDVDDL